MRKLLFIIALLFLSAPAVAENIMMPHIDIHQTLNPNKNVSDAMIENFYKHPEYIPVIDKECAETMGWVKGNFAFFEPLHHRAVFCLAWETNKKLNKEQIELLAQLNKAWSNVIMDLYQSDTYRNSFAVSFDNEQEYSLQLAVRIYNIVTQQKWPECFYETNEKDKKIMYNYIKPCNTPSKIMKNCRKEKNSLLCMQNQIINKINLFQTIKRPDVLEEEIKKERQDNFAILIKLTDELISQLIKNDKDKQQEIMRFYNFYWLSIIRSYKEALAYINND